MNRHDLVYVSPVAWQALIRARAEFPADPIVQAWVDRGWPLVSRRSDAGEPPGVPLGLPLPPSAGKKRLSFLMRHEDVVAALPAPSLASAARAAPALWEPTLLRLGRLASHNGAEARVFGSLALQFVTGLQYLTDRSDLDFALHVSRDTPLRALAKVIADLEVDAPMRLDGEFIRGGSAVNWRELHAGAREVLVKTPAGVSLLDADEFISGRLPT
ncbi:malonate decarboxylase holo-[acyl-carrier-protein] synthase [Chelatococcus asaccharovorans]|uniref:Phosphoribosyl-dephospho-CoA transferase n=1 Tax=Chelatococcus asaccharovorans TaxID=28210 RepID=A0A2V3UHZ2_9HYPH|nr:malonate decarboxylase holo-[acyl-carrier-protein] synthase [Chelatococcus asaccharovorans]MBS7705689.1 malonate decarboxylase holo-[acyl-carrier-protein] synthase [Chelatococcus asaccharovorans]PXW58708.1 phosphoribosyl-dephospho-CoA transferase [Chelatococcus asaccharovorans]